MAIKTIILPIQGMSCASCSRSVEKQLEQLVGVISKSVDFKANSGVFEIDDSIISKEQLIETINKGHYKVELPSGIKVSPSQAIAQCPTCYKQGQLVPNSVLRSNLKPATYKKIILEDEFLICMNSTCDNAYYTTKHKQLIDKSELKRELYFKQGSTKEIICYCNNVDKQQIKEAFQSQKLEVWEDVMSHYRTKVLEKCEVLNPTGLCCRELFEDVVQNFKNDNPSHS